MPAHGTNPFAGSVDSGPSGQPVGPPYGLGREPLCAHCGSYPAIKGSVRGHIGAIIMCAFPSTKGPFCRSCGMSEYRDMTDMTLKVGWWSLASTILCPLTLLWNLVFYFRIRRLPEPVPGSYRAPRPLGKPLHRRWSFAMLGLPLVVLAVLVAIPDDEEDAEPQDRTVSLAEVNPGQCIVNSGSLERPRMRVVDCAAPTGEALYEVLARLDGPSVTDDQCPSSTTIVSTILLNGRHTLCLRDMLANPVS